MKLCEYQRSMLLTDLGPTHSDSMFSNFFFSIIVKPIRAKFHVALPLDGECKSVQMV